MLSSIRNRLIIIALLVVGSIVALIPRSHTAREYVNGSMKDVTTKSIPLKYGLDLQGGVHLELELDQSQRVSSNPSRDIDLALTVMRKRIDQFGVSEPLIQKVGTGRIVIELAGLDNPTRAENIVRQNAFLEFRLTDKTGALESALPAMDRALAHLGVKAVGPAGAATNGVQALLGADSSKKADSGKKTTARKGADSAKTPADSGKVGSVLQALIQPAAGAGLGSTPGEYMVQETAVPRVDSLLKIPEVKALIPRGIDLKWSSGAISAGTEQVRFLYALEDKAIVTGSSLVDATAQVDPLTNRKVVAFQLDRAGARTFGEETGRHVGDYMAIVLDNFVQGRPPVIESRIDSRGQIELGNRSLQDAEDLALTLRAGALPIPLKIVAERQVLASLGMDSIHDGKVAGLVGTLLVIIIMVGYYRLAGVLAVFALGLYILFTFAGLAMIEATLTLPGLAGIVLSIGIAVDANVLVFERIREELIAGRTVRLAVDEGFKHAMNAIIDSNVSTVITALFLFQFGTGPVKGFAVTLIMGIAASMVTAVFVTRTLFLLWLQQRPTATSLSI
ncbi:MAG TPA: protein translocase subunit SecD [Gemmatimonadales bacterium]|jgi:preprotein translocase subunit SecD|nr:protein translocase subunit SecD [Gemmatimonadales bacterium]